ncbi:hypothetical protein Tco_0749687 [Tanacetum coccineum]|uniref:Uncharacterized protein n=1 Tax=Tanacetum coccineum TaxID=301880 RepID=A0ABQ4Z1Q0_9ASTR
MANNRVLFAFNSFFLASFCSTVLGGMGPSVPALADAIADHPRKLKRKDTKVPQPSGPTYNVADEAVYEEMDDSLERAAKTATSLDAEHDRVSPRRQDTMGDTIAQTGFENVSKTSNDSLLAGVNTPQSDKDSLKLNEDASKQGRIDDIDANEDIYLVNVHRDEDMFRVIDLEGDEVIVEIEVDHEVVVKTKVASKDVNFSVDEVTLAQSLAALKSVKPKVDKVMLQEPDQGTITTTAATTVTAVSIRPKVKGIVIHEEEQATTPTVSLKNL